MKLYSTDEIIKHAILDKKGFETHEDDLSYACHHKKGWLNIEEFKAAISYDKELMTLKQLKEFANMEETVKQKKIVEWDMMEIANFCNSYNSTGYGKAKIIQLKSHIIIELYNCGFSENEEMDTEFKKKWFRFVVLDRHPMLIAEFPYVKGSTSMFTKLINVERMEKITDCYSKQKEYNFSLEIQ